MLQAGTFWGADWICNLVLILFYLFWCQTIHRLLWTCKVLILALLNCMGLFCKLLLNDTENHPYTYMPDLTASNVKHMQIKRVISSLSRPWIQSCFCGGSSWFLKSLLLQISQKAQPVNVLCKQESCLLNSAMSHLRSAADGASLFPRWAPRAVIHVAKEEKNTLGWSHDVGQHMSSVLFFFFFCTYLLSRTFPATLLVLSLILKSVQT